MIERSFHVRNVVGLNPAIATITNKQNKNENEKNYFNDDIINNVNVYDGSIRV